MDDTGKQLRDEALSLIVAVLLFAVVVRDLKMVAAFLGACLVAAALRLAWRHPRRRSEEPG